MLKMRQFEVSSIAKVTNLNRIFFRVYIQKFRTFCLDSVGYAFEHLKQIPPAIKVGIIKHHHAELRPTKSVFTSSNSPFSVKYFPTYIFPIVSGDFGSFACIVRVKVS